MAIRTDYIGRPVFATNDPGVKVWEASYLPFGGVHTSTGSIDLRFPGQWFQAESGLHQNWVRDYDPTTGRYLQADPLGLVDGASVYGYAGQSPQRNIDPEGQEWRQYSLPDGNTGMKWVPGGSTYCPDGRCSVDPWTENNRDYQACSQQCTLSNERRLECLAAASVLPPSVPSGVVAAIAAMCSMVVAEYDCSQECHYEGGYCRKPDFSLDKWPFNKRRWLPRKEVWESRDNG